MRTSSLAGIAALLACVASPAAAEEFLVGSEISLTGINARGGGGMQEGITVAVDVFNRRSAKTKIKLVTIDDESSPAKAIGAVDRLGAQGVVAIVGGATSDIVGPAANAASKLGLVYVTSGGTSEELVSQGYRTFFRINNTAGYIRAMSGLLSDMAVKSVAVVYSTKKSTTELANGMNTALKAKGVQVTLHPFDPSITDFKPIINKVKLQDRPEAINMIGYENDYIGILRAAKQLRPPVKAMVGAWQLATGKMVADFPDLMPNLYGTAMLPFPAQFTDEEGREFHATYQRLHGKDPDYLGQFGFVQATLLFEAIDRAARKGPVTKERLGDEMRRTDRETLIGRVKFAANGDNEVFSHRMGQHQNGKVVIVWPKERATGKMNFPALPW